MSSELAKEVLAVAKELTESEKMDVEAAARYMKNAHDLMIVLQHDALSIKRVLGDAATILPIEDGRKIHQRLTKPFDEAIADIAKVRREADAMIERLKRNGSV